MAYFNHQVTKRPVHSHFFCLTDFSFERLENAGLLRCWNLGLFSIIWRADFDKDCGTFLSQCEYLKVL